jgi:hypothetical protein
MWLIMFYNDSRIRRVWCIGEERTMLTKRKALDAPHSPYALLGNVGLSGMISARCDSRYGGAYPRIVGAN